MEEKALETMGENKASYMMKDAVGKIPASDQEDVKELKQGLGNALGGGLQNPLGKFVSVFYPSICKRRGQQRGVQGQDCTILTMLGRVAIPPTTPLRR